MNRLVLAALLCLLFPNSLFAQTKDPTAIITRGEKRLRGRTSQTLMSMTIRRPSFTRKLLVRTWSDGPESTLVEILQPPKEAGVSSLKVSDQMWNYLFKTDSVVRVPTSLMLQSWMGSDFTNDDLMKSSSLARDYNHRVLRSERREGSDTTVIECTPKIGAPVVWGKVLYWARQKDDLPVREDYFDEDGKLVRSLSFRQFKKMDDRTIPLEVTVRKAEAPDEFTVVQYRRVLYDRALTSDLFSRDRLKANSQQGKALSRGWSRRPLPGRIPIPRGEVRVVAAGGTRR